MSEIVFQSSVSNEMKTSYLNYAMSVIISRALPDVRDGLKPVHRRILFVMNDLSLTHDRAFKKCASIVGNVISSYHPHGDAAIYETLVRLAQTFSLRYHLVDGQGNFGSVDGDRAAAYRYTEARMMKITALMMTDLYKETVDFVATFDDTKMEPTVLPSIFPNLLLNGTTGIAVGMATNIPPHHLGETLDACIYGLDHPDCNVDDFLQFIQGPDFPTGGIIYNYSSLVEAYRTGRGSFVVRSRTNVEDRAGAEGRENIIVTEIPYQVNKAEMIKKMAQLVRTDMVKGIGEIRDESDRNGIRVVIELKKDIDPRTVLNVFYKHTTLQISYGINAVALMDSRPQVLSLDKIIFAFLGHRKEVVRRRTQYLLSKTKQRLHIVEGFLHIAIPNMDAIVNLIRSSSDVSAARQSLIEKFSFSKEQANSILEMRLSRLVAIELEKLKKEELELKASVHYFESLLSDQQKLIGVIKDELLMIKKDFNDSRRTEICKDNLEKLEEQAFIHKDRVIISFTKSGYVKSILASIYRQQHRGGIGVKGTNTQRNEDTLAFIFSATTHDSLLFLSTQGRFFYFKVYEIPSASRTAKGIHARTLFDLEKGESFCGAIAVEKFSDETSFIMITKKGTIKRCLSTAFQNIRRKGLRAIGVNENDQVVSFVSTSLHEQEVMFFSKKGLAIRTPVKALRAMGRTARGVRAMRLSEDNEVISMVSTLDDTRILVVSKHGIGKIFLAKDFSIKGRAGKGQIYFRPDEKSGNVACVLALNGDGDVLITTSAGHVLRIAQEDIPVLSRTARGNRLVQIKSGFVSDVTYVSDL